MLNDETSLYVNNNNKKKAPNVGYAYMFVLDGVQVTYLIVSKNSSIKCLGHNPHTLLPLNSINLPEKKDRKGMGRMRLMYIRP